MGAVALEAAFEIFAIAVRAKSRNSLALVYVHAALTVECVTRIALASIVAVKVDALAAYARIAIFFAFIDIYAGS